MNIQFNPLQNHFASSIENSKVVNSLKGIFNVKNSDGNNSMAAIMQISKEGMNKLNHSRIESKEEILSLEEKIYDSQENTLKAKRDDLRTALEDLQKNLNDAMSNTTRILSTETEEDLLDAEEQLRQLKDEQEKMYESKKKEAQDIANSSAKQILEQQHDYAELYMIKKSLEEQNEDENKTPNVSSSNKIKTNIPPALSSDTPAPLESADYINLLSKEVGRIAYTGESRMDEKLQKMTDKYNKRMEQVATIHDSIKDALKNAQEICDNDQYTDKEKYDAVREFSVYAGSNLIDLAENKGIAMEIKYNVDSLNRERRSCNNLTIASNYMNDLSSIADTVKRIDNLKEALDSMKDESEDEYKEAIEEIDKTPKEIETVDESKKKQKKENEVSITPVVIPKYEMK